MKNTVFPHKLWRPFLDCMPQLFFRPQYVWFPVHLKGHLIPLCYETLVVNWQNWLFTLFHQSRSVLSPNPIGQLHKSQNAPVPYSTMLHSELKCAHFCSEWRIVGYGTGACWDLWNWSIKLHPYWLSTIWGSFCTDSPIQTMTTFTTTESLKLIVHPGYKCSNFSHQHNLHNP